jgi:hypothetical protein
LENIARFAEKLKQNTSTAIASTVLNAWLPVPNVSCANYNRSSLKPMPSLKKLER